MKDDMKILSGILSSGDVRRLPEEQLPELAREARETILKTAAENGVQIRYEASVGGAIPVIETIRKSLVANRITKVEGIVNGTTNYILTKMEEDNSSYADALKQAQAKGFAEADPTADVEGIDSANKLSILIAECQAYEGRSASRDPERMQA